MRDQIEIDVQAVEMKQVTPQAGGRYGGVLIERQAEGFVFIQSHQAGLGMLDGVKDAIDTGFHGKFHEAAGGLGDGLQAFQHGLGILAQMNDQPLTADQVFGLRQRAENRLE